MFPRRARSEPSGLSDQMFGMMNTLRDLQDAMGSLFQDVYGSTFEWGADEPAGQLFTPLLNAYRLGSNFVVDCLLPGVRREDIVLAIHNQVLTISGEIRGREEVADSDYTVCEHRPGPFERTLRLPASVDVSHVQARYQDGMLRITLALGEEAPGPEFQIEVE